MKTYILKCKKDTENIVSKMCRAKNNRLFMQSQCSNCGNKKWRFVKEWEAKGLLSDLGIGTPLSKIQDSFIKCFILRRIKMNEIINKFLLVGDKFMPKMHLK